MIRCHCADVVAGESCGNSSCTAYAVGAVIAQLEDVMPRERLAVLDEASRLLLVARARVAGERARARTGADTEPPREDV